MTAPREPGRALDAEIAEKVMGWAWKRDQSFHVVTGNLIGEPWRFLIAPGSPLAGIEDARGDEAVRSDRNDAMPHYSTEIADAWLVVEHMRAQGWRASLIACEAHPESPTGYAYGDKCTSVDSRSTRYEASPWFGNIPIARMRQPWRWLSAGLR